MLNLNITNENILGLRSQDILITRYTDIGISGDKIHFSRQNAVAYWNSNHKCLVGENDLDTIEFIPNLNGGGELTYKNNFCVSLLVYDITKITSDIINKINNSQNGIIVVDYDRIRNEYRQSGHAVNDDPNLIRFGLID
jgi:hypothetical protein